jgi:hypothetical protein
MYAKNTMVCQKLVSLIEGLEPMGILRHTQGKGDIKAHPKGAQLGAQQEGTNSVAISIQGMPFGHHAMLLPIFLFPWSMRWCV